MVSEAERIEELEIRVNALERKLAVLERGPPGLRGLMERLVPRDVRDHLRAARREYILAWRAYLDRMIGRLEEEQQRRERQTRRRVKVD